MTRRYPTKAEIGRAVEAAKASGIEVAGVELSPNGNIKITAAGASASSAAATDFDTWDRAGRL